jgi:hypothetical protein
MKKIILISTLALFVMLAISCKTETNDSKDDHYGKVIVHNESASGKTIKRIHITDISMGGISSATTYYNEQVSIAPGKSSNEYELELMLIYDILYSGFNVTITLDDNNTHTAKIKAYEDIVNQLYFNGTDLVEKQ